MIEEYPFTFSDDRKTLEWCDCSYKGDVIIPNGVTIIGDGAFEGCCGLKEFHSRIEDVYVFEKECILDDVDRDTCIVYIPVGCVENYRNCYPFKDFKHIVEEGSSADYPES